MKSYSFDLSTAGNDLIQKIKKICGNWWKKIKIEVKEVKKEELVLSVDGNEILFFNGVHFCYKELFDKTIEFLNEKYSSLDYSFVSYDPERNTLTTTNNREQEFLFLGNISKMEPEILSFAECLRQALELFINAEIAILKCYVSLKDAKVRNRIDLIEKYTEQMSELVKLSCFAETLKVV